MLEHQLDAFSLLLIRQCVNIEIAKLREAPQEKKAGWFSGWWGGAKKQEENKGTIGKYIYKCAYIGIVVIIFGLEQATLNKHREICFSS